MSAPWRTTSPAAPGVAPFVTVIGDALLDRDILGRGARRLADADAPVIDVDNEVSAPGGGALTALAVSGLGCPTTFVTALGDDEAGATVRCRLERAGVEVIDLHLDGPTPEKTRLRHHGEVVARIDRGGARSAIGPVTATAIDAVTAADGVLVSDYGRGMAAHLTLIGALAPETPVVWDPHPNGGRPGPQVWLATPNLGEAQGFLDAPDLAPEFLATELARRWTCHVAVTCGANGAVTSDGVSSTWCPTKPVTGDPCGAGDWFAAAATRALASGSSILDAVAAGCAAAGAWIARPPAPDRPVIVATSGCFDILHTGHLELLRHARSLGDRLVVLLNSDASVRRLKGPDRPVNGEHDRAAMLLGIGCVDEVRVFDASTPVDELHRLRPDVYVKGDEYRARRIPEETALADWGGRLVHVPMLAGRSTTAVIRRARLAH